MLNHNHPNLLWQWYEWIESTINKEVLTKIIKDKKPQAAKGDAKKGEAKPA